MPPLDGPRDVLWWTRYPVNTRIEPSSMRVGMATSRVRRGLRSTSCTPGSRSMILAASSSCWRADSQADPELTADNLADEPLHRSHQAQSLTALACAVAQEDRDRSARFPR